MHVKTVSHWRAEPEYLAERDHWQRYSVERLQPVLQKLKAAALVVHQSALERLAEALVATDPDGHQLWETQLRAARIIAESPVIRALVAPRASGGAGTQASASAVVQLVGRREEGGGTVIEYGPNVEEVEENEDGQENRNPDDRA